MSLFLFNNCMGGGAGIVSETSMSTHRNSKNFIDRFLIFTNLFSTCWGDDDTLLNEEEDHSDTTNDVFLLPDHDIAATVDVVEKPSKKAPAIMIIQDIKTPFFSDTITTATATTTTTTINPTNKDDASVVSVHTSTTASVSSSSDDESLLSSGFTKSSSTVQPCSHNNTNKKEPVQSDNIQVNDCSSTVVGGTPEYLVDTVEAEEAVPVTPSKDKKDDDSVVSIHTSSPVPVTPSKDNEDDASVVSVHTSSPALDDESLLSKGSTKPSTTGQSSSLINTNNKEPIQSNSIQVNDCSTVVGRSWEYLVDNIEEEVEEEAAATAAAALPAVAPSKNHQKHYYLLIIGFGVVSYLMVRGGVANSFRRT